MKREEKKSLTQKELEVLLKPLKIKMAKDCQEKTSEVVRKKLFAKKGNK